METPNRAPVTVRAKRNLYYTNDYEWIDFQGAVAYIGVCRFKLAGIKKIEKIDLSQKTNSKKRGEVLASILYEDYKIDIHMPISGKIISFNNSILSGNEDIVLVEPETSGYIALIVPSSPYEREGLINSPKYSVSSKTT